MNANEFRLIGLAAFGRTFVKQLAQRLGMHAFSVGQWARHGVPDQRVPQVIAACRAQAAENKRQVMRLSRHAERELRRRQEARQAKRAENLGPLYHRRKEELERYLRWFQGAQKTNRGFRNSALRNGKPIPDWLKGVYVSD